MSDLRHAFRSLRRAPTVTGAAVLCLALGLGATSAIFSAVNTALFRPLPFRDPAALVTVFRTTPHFETGPFSPGNYLDLARETRSLEGLAAIAPNVVLLEGTDESRRVSAYRAADNLFALLGAQAVTGRLFRPGDGGADQPLVAVMGEEMWRDQFGADPAIVGRTVRLGGQSHEILGVVPAGFRVPQGNQLLSSDLWVTLRFRPDEATWRRNNFMWLLGRLQPTSTVAAADAELRSVMDGIVEQHAELRGEQLRVLPLQREATRTVRGPLLLLLGATLFVLLIAVSNVASLLLARGIERRREVAVRAALGASPGDVIRRALVESALLAGAGLAAGLGLALAGVRVIGALAAARLPQLTGLGLDWRVAGVATLLAALVAVACGIAPAWRAAAADPQDALRSGTRTGAGSGHHRYLRALVSAEVGLSLVLLLGAGLVLRSFVKLVSEDPGFDPRTLLTLSLNTSPERYPDGDVPRRFLEPALDAVRQVPGVVEAGAISLIPFVGWGNNWNVRYEGQTATDPTTLPLVENRVVTPSYFRTMGIALVRGRMLEPSDDERDDSPAVVVVNQALVARDLQGQDPIGKRFHTGDTTFGTIVGVVENVQNAGPGNAPRPEMYWSYRQSGRRSTGFPVVVRTTGDPSAVTRAVTATVRTVDPSAAVSQVLPMPEVIARSTGRSRFYLALLGTFAGVAVALAVAGLYGVTSYMVAQRTRELGIRSALGSTPRHTLRLVLGQGMALAGLGIAAGLAGALGITRLLRGLLHEVSPVDPATWVAVTGTLALVALVALVAPARRAARVEPIVAIREE